MIFRRALILFFLPVILPALSGCGWMEFPPSQWQAQPAKQSAGKKSARTSSKSSGQASSNKSSAAKEKNMSGTAVVRKGDTVYALSRRHRVGVRSLIKINRFKPPYTLMVGQRITLPKPRDHIVQKGDNIYSVSRRYGVGRYGLARTNGLKVPYTIMVGQRLRLPDGIESPTVPESGPGNSPTGAVTSQPLPVTGKKMPAAVPEPPRATGKGFIWPVKGKVISRFGGKAKGLHNDGINISAPRGAAVKVVENGVIAYAGNELRGFGNLLLVKHDGGWVTAYAHNEELLVKRGRKVRKGEVIAKVGSTGNVRSPQLHFELRRGNRAVDPAKHLKI